MTGVIIKSFVSIQLIFVYITVTNPDLVHSLSRNTDTLLRNVDHGPDFHVLVTC